MVSVVGPVISAALKNRPEGNSLKISMSFPL
jgi:hypothetical protein